MTEESRRPADEPRDPETHPAAFPPDRDEESRLVDRARAGDTRAFARLVAAHQDRIHGLIARLVRDAGLAEELTQDTFIRAYRALDRFRGEARFGTWLYRIALNLCRDQRGSTAARLRARETSLDGPGFEGMDPPAVGTRPDQELEIGEVAAHFEAGLAALDGIHREAFLLRHQEGLNYDEIAESLGVSVSNAKVRVHRAREAILAELRRRGFDV